MARRHGQRARRQSVDKNTIWTATLISIVQSTAVVGTVLVGDDDWFGGTGQARGTIIAVRGWLAIRPNVVGSGSLFAYIGLIDEDITTPPAATSVDTYVDEDIMFTFGYSMMDEAVTGFESATTRHDFGKSKRKIRTGQDLRLVTQSDTTNGFGVVGILRTLIDTTQR